jgi:hypothetical protein
MHLGRFWGSDQLMLCTLRVSAGMFLLATGCNRVVANAAGVIRKWTSRPEGHVSTESLELGWGLHRVAR